MADMFSVDIASVLSLVTAVTALLVGLSTRRKNLADAVGVEAQADRVGMETFKTLAEANHAIAIQLRADIVGMQDRLTASEAATETRIASIREAARVECERYKADVAALSEKYSALASEYDSLRASFVALQLRNDKLEAGVKVLIAQVRSLGILPAYVPE